MAEQHEGNGGSTGTGDRQEAPGGRRDGAAGNDIAHPGTGTVGGSPTGPSGGDAPAGPGANGSYGTGTYNNQGDLTGPDGQTSNEAVPGQGQGDDSANRLGGDQGRGTGMAGGGSVTGDLSASSSEADEERPSAAGTGSDPGAPGGMGGVRAAGSGTGRPPGGSSPMSEDRD